ncbi:MFS transporter [Pantoea sp. Bo_2]|uniref:MFS transporter n=1 Tax=Candidatus Pantoea gossypiicola TaxID=2608008 RepID=A0AB34CP35_9GAMM|nr:MULTISPECIES: MFS transporter [Pantoea]KAA5933011.1 MFS transporter [Pantoea sp. VH_8]KAA5937798.1 MFS transporter [Pantoea sp. VH_4]KAA5950419.1 MFS transporter [Pantoea sp. VH_3]KAA5955791.1 MFS transporter [Pantoea sp. VH_25]KAA5960045.1 MFS transporter [Pantoea sp. VH_24]
MNKFQKNAQAFQHSSFRYLFFGRLFTVLGNGIAPIALAFAVLDIGGSASDLGMVVASRSLFNVLFLLVGGVIADRYSRSRVLVVSALVAAVSQAFVAWSVLEGSASVISLTLLGALNGASAGIALPASSALVPQVVPARHLRQANALIQLGVYGGTVMGASLGGVITSAVGPGWGLAIDALGFAASAPLYFFIRVNAEKAGTLSGNILQDLKEGWAEFAGRSWIWSIVVQFAVINVAFNGIVVVLGPMIADASFGRTQWGIIVAAHSAGLIAGSLLAMKWHPRRDLFTGAMLAGLYALPIFMLSQNATAIWLIAGFFIAGTTLGLFGVIWAHSLQTHIPPDKLARVYAYDAMGSFIAIPFGQLVAGPLAAKYDMSNVLLMSALAVIIATAGVGLVPAVRQPEKMGVQPRSL